MATYTQCRWVDDKCQHGHWIDDREVTFTSASTGPGKTAKYLCPKGQQA